MVPSPAKVAIATLESLATPPARQLSTGRQRSNGRPWTLVILIDSPLQHRASLHPENAQTFQHGKGSVSGHPWTTLVLILGDRLMPLRPIPFSSKRYGQAQALDYPSAHARVVASLRTLDLEDSLGASDRREGLGLAASGSDHTKSAKAMADQGWHGMIALSTTRSVPSEALALTTPHSQQWCHIDPFFRRHRRLTWHTMRLTMHGKKRQRLDCRVRHPAGSWRSVGQVALVCAARRHRPDGRRTYRACNALRATARQMVRGYRMRWAVELLQTRVKQHLGFEAGATQGFDAVIAPVHWVYSADILLHMSPPGLAPGVQSLGDTQRALQHGLADTEKRHVLQKLTHIGGVQRDKAELRQALTGT